MCYQLIELYSACRCVYYQHAVDRCASYGRTGHSISQRTILVGNFCYEHSADQRCIVEASSDDDADNEAEVASTAAITATPQRTLSSIIRDSRRKYQDPVSLGLRVPQISNSQVTSGTALLLQGSSPNPSSSQTVHSLPDQDDDELVENAQHSSDDEAIELESDFEENVHSSVPSLSSLGAISYMDGLVNGLIFDTDLQFLWPQLILRSSSMTDAETQITHLISRYATDLEVLATSSEFPSANGPGISRLRTAKFVWRKKRPLAEEICRYFRLEDVVAIDEANISSYSSPEKESRVEESADEEDDSGDETPEAATLVLLKEFLFDSEPFRCFKANVQVYVERNATSPTSTQGIDFIRGCFKKLSYQLWKPVQQPGSRRLHWTCTCGYRIYDDYVEHVDGALDDLKGLLTVYSGQTRGPNDLESNNPAKPAAPSGEKENAATLRNNDIKLPWQWQRKKTIKPGECPASSAARPPPADTGHNYLLACIPFGRFITRLYQPEICTINSDQDFFSLLRLLYRENTTASLTRPLSWLRRVRAIHFVQLELFDDALSEVRARPSLPPPPPPRPGGGNGLHQRHALSGEGEDYSYEPTPASLVPPIGPNILAHFFENPTHAAVLPRLYRRIPKKLRRKLVPCAEEGSSVGWGIEFVEGIDGLAFFACGCVGFMMCLVVAWTVAKGGDVQGGFGIGGFLLAFMGFCGSIVWGVIEKRQ